MRRRPCAGARTRLWKKPATVSGPSTLASRSAASAQPSALRAARTSCASLGRGAAKRATTLALAAAHRWRSGRHGLNLGDCLHYACAKYYRVPILATADEFRQTDLETVP